MAQHAGQRNLACRAWAAESPFQGTTLVAGYSSETFDVGANPCSPVKLDYFDRVPFKFNGHIGNVHVIYLPNP